MYDYVNDTLKEIYKISKKNCYQSLNYYLLVIKYIDIR